MLFLVMGYIVALPVFGVGLLLGLMVRRTTDSRVIHLIVLLPLAVLPAALLCYRLWTMEIIDRDDGLDLALYLIFAAPEWVLGLALGALWRRKTARLDNAETPFDENVQRLAD